MEKRILTPWDSSRPPEGCEAVLLDRSGALYSGAEQGFAALARNAVYFASCPEGFLARRDFTSDTDGIASDDTVNLDRPLVDSGPGFSDLRDPFYASTFPVFYVLAATTVIAYMLVIMLFITPRSFVNGGIVYLGRRNRFSSSSSSAVDIGGRPWLQKVAALTVAISLTVATGATFRVTANQYAWGVQNAFLLQKEVMDSTALKVIRLISDTFLWLAQAQTLIRLFQRQREKVIIKWVAFALITLDVIFSALNSFQYTNSGSNGNMRPRTFIDAIPALSYLFQLSLGLLYAAWVIYYSILKKRYAFYHPLMKNMPLVAVISLLSILIPVVFFILDISKPELTGWGDYVRWVGAAAASVVVWEWVERIEALEREEKKDGILGRQVFDGDDMMEVTGSSASSWSRFRKDDSDGGGNGTGDWSVYGGPFASGRGSIRASLAYRSRPAGSQGRTDSFEEGDRGNLEPLRPPAWPGLTGTPVSRTDTGSVDSTVYAVRYQNQSDTTGRTPDPGGNTIMLSRSNSLELTSSTPRPEDGERQPSASTQERSETNLHTQDSRNSSDVEANSVNTREGGWRGLTGFFRRDPQPPPAAVLPHHRRDAPRPEMRQRDELGKWDLRARLEDFAATRAEKVRERMRPTTDTEQLRTTVIPAPPRRGAALQELLEEEGLDGSVSGESGVTDPEYVAPPMWPGVYPVFVESSRGSFESGEEEEEEEERRYSR